MLVFKVANCAVRDARLVLTTASWNMRLSIIFDWAHMLSRFTTVAFSRFVKALVALLKSKPLMTPFA